jgi:hypothetical protein
MHEKQTVFEQPQSREASFGWISSGSALMRLIHIIWIWAQERHHL